MGHYPYHPGGVILLELVFVIIIEQDVCAPETRGPRERFKKVLGVAKTFVIMICEPYHKEQREHHVNFAQDEIGEHPDC